VNDSDRAAALERLRILDAMVRVMDDRDEFMRLVGAAPSADVAYDWLRRVYGFDGSQAIAVLDLQVRRFAAAERDRVAEERDEMQRLLGEPS
jgi:DNA gyrase subunit A